MPSVLQQRNVPGAIRALDTLVSADYVDLFTATASEATDKSPETTPGPEGPGVCASVDKVA